MSAGNASTGNGSAGRGSTRSTSPDSPRRPHVVVVGGGLAGLAAALRCADGGAAVSLLERRPRLGGLTWSFEHNGRWIDNGQHVFLRCCDAYRAFLARIGSAGDVTLQKRLDVTVLRPGAGGEAPALARLRRNSMPAPLHLAPSLLAYRHLPVADRLRLGRAALALRRVRLDDPALDRESFAAWLARHGQGERAVRAVWDLITVPTVNLPASQASAAMGAKVFQTGLLTEAAAADIGWSQVPLGRLHGERAGSALRRAGAEVCVGERVLSVSEVKGGPPRLQVRTDRRDLDADAVVMAVPHHAVNEILPPSSFQGQERIEELAASPIVDVHVVYDRAVMDLPFAAALDSPVQWVFDRTRSSGMAGGGQYLAVSISAAASGMGRRPAELVDEALGALGDLFPAARRARVLDSLVTKERSATFRAAPGSGALRPGPETAMPALFLAGAWTDTGWPATMEGAVRSGVDAARAALRACSAPRGASEGSVPGDDAGAGPGIGCGARATGGAGRAPDAGPHDKQPEEVA